MKQLIVQSSTFTAFSITRRSVVRNALCFTISNTVYSTASLTALDFVDIMNKAQKTIVEY